MSTRIHINHVSFSATDIEFSTDDTGPFRKHGTVAVSSTGSLNMIGATMALLLEPPIRKMEPLPETAALPCFRKGL